MRIVIGIFLLLFGLPLLLGSLYRLSQVGETLVIYPMQPGMNRLGPITLSPHMNPIEVRLRGHWIHHHRPSANDALSGEVTLVGPDRQILWQERHDFSAPADESASSRPTPMEETALIRTFQVENSGHYRFDILVRKGRSAGRNLSLRVDIGRHDYTWSIPLVSGAMTLAGLYYLITGAIQRQRDFHTE